MSKWSNPVEIRIPNSYGYIAAKAWGKEQHEPVLALHGWQDNAGSFDRLIPLLNKDLYIVAIDAPGHGLSSHLPAGTWYHYMDNMVEIKKIVDYLKWDKFSMIGHSLGAVMSILYSCIFPNDVKNLILLDILKPISYDADFFPGIMQTNIKDVIQFERKLSNPAPVYSPESARKRLVDGLYNQVKPEYIDCLLKRGCQPSKCGKGVVFSRDIRVQVESSFRKLSHDTLMGYLKNLQCNLLVILAKDTPKMFRNHPPETLDEYINLYRKTCKSFKLLEVDGNHFVHLNHPERVAPVIDDFFIGILTSYLKYKCLNT